VTDRRLRLLIAALCLIGIGVAGYLTYEHYSGGDVKCFIAHGCATVQKSQWASLAGIPVAVLGLIGYVGLLGSLLIRGDAGRIIGSAIALPGFAFSMYLTYRELYSIHAICAWCVTSAVLMTLLAILTSVRFVRGDDPAPVTRASNGGEQA
jgi:uncharacterized membrane protein